MLQSLKNAYENAGIRTGVALATLAVPGLSFAQAVDPFDTALDDITTKTGTYAAALVGVAAIAVGFMVAMKYVKKLPRAS